LLKRRTEYRFNRKNKEKKHEKNVSTQKETEKQSARIQRKNVHEGRQKRFEEKKKQGKKEPFQVIFHRFPAARLCARID
jgi:hypothetical protein